jgi:RimJ/RimL family protein N-acetyltransferase
MLGPVFEEHGAKAIRGVVPVDNKPSRRLAKYVGCETFSIETYPDGEKYELMILSKERYNQFKERYNGS